MHANRQLKEHLHGGAGPYAKHVALQALVDTTPLLRRSGDIFLSRQQQFASRFGIQ